MQRLPTTEDEAVLEGGRDENERPPSWSVASRGRVMEILTRTLLPDEFAWRSGWFGEIVVGEAHVKCLKFGLVSYAFLLGSHWWIRSHGNTSRWERDEEYSLAEFHLLDLHPCALDCLWFFVVGRFWKRRGVDSARSAFASAAERGPRSRMVTGDHL